MAFEKKSPRWRDWLTAEEAVRVAEIDALVSDLRIVSLERGRIANRALQRAKAQDRREAVVPPPSRQRA